MQEEEKAKTDLSELFAAMDKFREEKDCDPDFPLEITSVISHGFGVKPKGIGASMGDWVSIRPCDEKYEKKTFLGIYLGEIPIRAQFYLDKETKGLEIVPEHNPAIYIPDLKKIIFGCESWWGKVNSPEDLRKITDIDIEDLWYVKALKEMEDLDQIEKQ